MATRVWEPVLTPTGGIYEGIGPGRNRDLYLQASEYSRAMYINSDFFDLCIEAERRTGLRVLRIW